MLAVIVLAGICVGLETYPNASHELQAALFALDQFLKFIFLLELVIKIIAEGLKPWHLFSDNWNTFDFVIVIVLFIPIEGGSPLYVLRLLRILRALKIMSAVPVRPDKYPLMLLEGNMAVLPGPNYLYRTQFSFIHLFVCFFCFRVAIANNFDGGGNGFEFCEIHTDFDVLVLLRLR